MLTFLIHLEVRFLQDDKYGTIFILLHATIQFDQYHFVEDADFFSVNISIFFVKKIKCWKILVLTVGFSLVLNLILFIYVHVLCWYHPIFIIVPLKYSLKQDTSINSFSIQDYEKLLIRKFAKILIYEFCLSMF